MKFNKMKKISLYIFLVLMWCNVGFAEKFISSTFNVTNALKSTMENGFVKCGVSGLPAFSSLSSSGNWSGIDVDVCRAVAAAVLGDANKVKFIPLKRVESFASLNNCQDKKKCVDILSRHSTWTLSRDSFLNFAGINFIDGNGFIVRKKSGIKSTKDFKNGISICGNVGTQTALNTKFFFKSIGKTYELLPFEKAWEVVAAYDSGRCDTYVTDRTGLMAQRTKMTNPDEHLILPEIISKEPLGPVVREFDPYWENVVRWSLNTMIVAEELGVTSLNIDEMKNSENPKIKRLIGIEGRHGEDLYLDQEWSYRIIKQVGNYGESYERNLGYLLPERGPNNLWKNGGFIFVGDFR